MKPPPPRSAPLIGLSVSLRSLRASFCKYQNPVTVSTFSVSSYFTQINPLVSYFLKHNENVGMCFCFFKIEECLKIAILPYCSRSK